MSLFFTTDYGTPVKSRLRTHYSNGIYSQFQYLDLPNEILFMITEYLEPADLNSLIQASRQFYRLLGSHLYWVGLDFVRTDGTSVLEWAAREGRLETASQVLAVGKSQVTREEACLALYLAASNGYAKIMQLFFFRLPCFNSLKPELFVLEGTKHSELLRLFRHGLNPNGSVIGSALYVGAYNGHVDVVRTLLVAQPSREAKCEAICAGAARGHAKVVKLLLNAGMVNDSEAVADSLRDAARGGHTRVVELIATSGAKFDASIHEFMNAVYNRRQEVEIPVVPYPDVPFSMLSHKLCAAVGNGRMAIAHVLFGTVKEYEIPPDTLIDALHEAASEGNQAVTHLILDRGSSTLSDADISHALYIAIKSGSVEVAELLLKRGAQPGESYDLGRTSLHEASAKGYFPVVTLLLDARADTTVKTWKGETAAHLAAMHGHGLVLQELIYAGANMASEDVFELTPLHWAAYRGHEMACRVLIEGGGAAMSAMTSRGWTPLNLAALESHERVVELLLAKNGLTLSFETIKPVLPAISMRSFSLTL